MARTLVASIVAALAVTAAWLSLEEPRLIRDALLVAALAIGPALAPAGRARLVAVVPASLGVQEGGYVLVGALFGLSPEAALALSLLKRARDFVLGIPALMVWQVVEGTQLRRRANPASCEGSGAR